MTDKTLESNEKALQIFQQVILSSEWVGSTTEKGQEIVYLFLAKALMLNVPDVFAAGNDFTTDQVRIREERLVSGTDALTTALKINPEYARAHNGLGIVLFQRAINPRKSGRIPCPLDDILLGQAAVHLKQALTSNHKPESGHVDFVANLNLGRIHYYLGLCSVSGDRATHWEIAEQYIVFALKEYEDKSTNGLDQDAVLGYSILGEMQAKMASELTLSHEAEVRLNMAALENFTKGWEIVHVSQYDFGELRMKLVLDRALALCKVSGVPDARSFVNEALSMTEKKSGWVIQNIMGQIRIRCDA